MAEEKLLVACHDATLLNYLVDSLENSGYEVSGTTQKEDLKIIGSKDSPYDAALVISPHGGYGTLFKSELLDPIAAERDPEDFEYTGSMILGDLKEDLGPEEIAQSVVRDFLAQLRQKRSEKPQ